MPVVFYYLTDNSLYAKFDDASNTCVDLGEGSGLKEQRYEATDSAIHSAALSAGTYSVAIMIGAAGSASADDPLVGALGTFKWDGTNEIVDASVDLSEVLELLTSIQGEGFETTLHSLVDIAQKLGIGTDVPPPVTDTPSSDAVGTPVTELFNISASQLPINYNVNTGDSVTSVRAGASGQFYLQAGKRLLIETSRLVPSQIDNLKNAGLIEVFRRVIKVQ